MERAITIKVEPGRSVSGKWRVPDQPSSTTVLLAHGAGAGQDHPAITSLAEGLVGQGFPVLTFNYPYMEAGRRFPDRQEVLLRCHRAAATWLEQQSYRRLVLAGRSMGGRMASYLAAEGQPCDGLVLYAYPLHPAGKPDRIRADHLLKVTVPMLFFVGERDRLALPHLVEQHLATLERGELKIIPHADHSFNVPKRVGSRQLVLKEIVEHTAQWIKGLK